MARGEDQDLAGLLFAYSLTPLLATFIVLAAPHWIGYRNPLGVSAIIAVLGFAGFVFLGGWHPGARPSSPDLRPRSSSYSSFPFHRP